MIAISSLKMKKPAGRNPRVLNSYKRTICLGSSTLETSAGLELHCLGRLNLDFFTGAGVHTHTGGTIHYGKGAKANKLYGTITADTLGDAVKNRAHGGFGTSF